MILSPAEKVFELMNEYGSRRQPFLFGIDFDVEQGFFLDPAKAGDSRWVHRPSADWERYEKRHDLTTLEGRIYHGFCRLIELRKKYPVFSGTEIQVIDTGNPRVFAYVRSYENMRAVVFANFSEREQTIPDNLLRLYGIGYKFTDLLGGAEINTQNITLLPYDFRALATLA